MRARRRATLPLVVVAVLVATMLLAGCAARKTDDTPIAESAGHDLAYKMPEGASLRYEMTSAMTQTVVVRDQSAETETTSASALTVNSTGMRNGAYRLDVTIDDMKIDVTGPGGSFSPDLASVIGQSFEMGLTAIGDEVDFPEHDAIQYDVGPAGKRSAVSMFSMMFPNVAGRPVEIGDTWTTTDGFTDEGDGFVMAIDFEAINTLAGFETFGGYECARITTMFTGTTSAGWKEGPADVTSEGDIEGTSVWYFAPKEGILVSDATESTGTSTILAMTPEGEMEIPATMVTKFETHIVP